MNREEKSDGVTRQTSGVTLWRNETSGDNSNFVLDLSANADFSRHSLSTDITGTVESASCSAREVNPTSVLSEITKLS